MKNTLFLLVLAIVLAGCSDGRNPASGAPKELARLAVASDKAEPLAQPKSEKNKFLAYEHTVALVTEEPQIKPLYERLLAYCKADEVNSCVVLESNLSADGFPRAHLKIRAKADGINFLFKMAAESGRVMNQETRVEDLAGPIVDAGRRLEMLNLHQKKLIELDRKAGYDIDNQIKISKELASVQSDIEQLNGEQARLNRRVATDILSLSLAPDVTNSAWTPISHSLREVGRNLSQGIATVIYALPYILPWVVILMIGFVVTRKLLRRHKG